MHNQVQIKPDDKRGIENLTRHILRNTFSLKKALQSLCQSELSSSLLAYGEFVYL